MPDPTGERGELFRDLLGVFMSNGQLRKRDVAQVGAALRALGGSRGKWAEKVPGEWLG